MYVLLFTLVVCVAARYHNSYDGRLYFTCPAHQSITTFHSIHNNGNEDRRFGLSCSSIKSSLDVQRTERCSWSQYVNDFDEVVLFQCPHSGYIAGIDSYHHNGYEDRRFKFYCCQTSGLRTQDCYYTGNLNEYDEPVSYTVPSGRVLHGIFSAHHNGYEYDN